MTKEVILDLDEFAHRALQRVARSRGSRSAALRTASRYYLADSSGPRLAWRMPRFLRGEAEAEEPHRVRVRLDADTWHALEDEAARQEVSLPALAQHALLYFASDLESGRIVGRLEDALSSP